MARLLGASSIGGFSTRPVIVHDLVAVHAGLRAGLDGHGAVLVDVLPADVEQRDHRAAVLGLDGEHVLEQVVAGVDQVVAEQDRERLVADERAPPAAPRGRAPSPRPAGRSAPGRCRWTRARRPAGRRRPSSPAPPRARGAVEEVLDGRLVAAGDHQHLGQPGPGGLLDDVLQRRPVDDRQQLLGHGLGGRAGSACPSPRRG